jgi:hypothetical protein
MNEKRKRVITNAAVRAQTGARKIPRNEGRRFTGRVYSGEFGTDTIGVKSKESELSGTDSQRNGDSHDI